MLFYIRPSIGRKAGVITEDSFGFSGSYDFVRDEQSGNWELALYDSSSLVWYKDPGSLDIFIIGSGQDGGDAFFSGGGSGNWEFNDSYINSGAGGDGARMRYLSGVSLDSAVEVVIGENGGDTFIGPYSSANGATPKKGGTGATMRQATNSAGTLNKGGDDGVFAYNADTDETMVQALAGKRFGASGGAGYANNNYRNNGNLWPVWTDEQRNASNKGGETGAGNGGDRDHHDGYDATGIGNGGGGGYGDGAYHDLGHGGKGSKGAVLIRNHREVS